MGFSASEIPQFGDRISCTGVALGRNRRLRSWEVPLTVLDRPLPLLKMIRQLVALLGESIAWVKSFLASLLRSQTSSVSLVSHGTEPSEDNTKSPVPWTQTFEDAGRSVLMNNLSGGADPREEAMFGTTRTVFIFQHDAKTKISNVRSFNGIEALLMVHGVFCRLPLSHAAFSINSVVAFLCGVDSAPIWIWGCSVCFALYVSVETASIGTNRSGVRNPIVMPFPFRIWLVRAYCLKKSADLFTCVQGVFQNTTDHGWKRLNRSKVVFIFLV